MTASTLWSLVWALRSRASLRKRVLIRAVRRGHLVTLRFCVPELRATLRLSHADYSQLTLLVVAAFAVYIFARICLPVSKLPQPIRLICAWLTLTRKLEFYSLFILYYICTATVKIPSSAFLFQTKISRYTFQLLSYILRFSLTI